MLRSALAGGFEVLVLTNAMRPMRRFEAALADLNDELGARLTMRVSNSVLQRERSQPKYCGER